VDRSALRAVVARFGELAWLGVDRGGALTPQPKGVVGGAVGKAKSMSKRLRSQSRSRNRGGYRADASHWSERRGGSGGDSIDASARHRLLKLRGHPGSRPSGPSGPIRPSMAAIGRALATGDFTPQPLRKPANS